jgi:hypothetical protein
MFNLPSVRNVVIAACAHLIKPKQLVFYEVHLYETKTVTSQLFTVIWKYTSRELLNNFKWLSEIQEENWLFFHLKIDDFARTVRMDIAFLSPIQNITIFLDIILYNCPHIIEIYFGEKMTPLFSVDLLHKIVFFCNEIISLRIICEHKFERKDMLFIVQNAQQIEQLTLRRPVYMTSNVHVTTFINAMKNMNHIDFVQVGTAEPHTETKIQRIQIKKIELFGKNSGAILPCILGFVGLIGFVWLRSRRNV